MTRIGRMCARVMPRLDPKLPRAIHVRRCGRQRLDGPVLVRTDGRLWKAVGGGRHVPVELDSKALRPITKAEWHLGECGKALGVSEQCGADARNDENAARLPNEKSTHELGSCDLNRAHDSTS